MTVNCYRCGDWNGSGCSCADGQTVIHGDCREVLPLIDAGAIDLVLTDPPYGVGYQYDSFVDDNENWKNVRQTIESIIDQYGAVALCMSFTRLWEMPPAKWAACWFKPGSVRRSKIGGWSTWEPVLLYGNGWKIANDLLRLPDCVNHSPGNSHSCPKPLALFRWLISGHRCKTILDPFAGSFTTARAAKDLGRKSICVELEEKYVEIGCRRLEQGVLAFEGVTA